MFFRGYHALPCGLSIGVILGIGSAVPPHWVAPYIGVLSMLIGGESLCLVIRQLQGRGQTPATWPILRIVFRGAFQLVGTCEEHAAIHAWIHYAKVGNVSSAIVEAAHIVPVFQAAAHSHILLQHNVAHGKVGSALAYSIAGQVSRNLCIVHRHHIGVVVALSLPVGQFLLHIVDVRLDALFIGGQCLGLLALTEQHLGLDEASLVVGHNLEVADRTQLERASRTYGTSVDGILAAEIPV